MAHTVADTDPRLTLAHLQFDRFHNGGSLGRRTLVRKDFDVDLSVFVTEFTGRVLDYWAGDWSGEAGERLQVDMMKDVAAWLCDQNFKAVEVEHGTHYKHCINVSQWIARWPGMLRS